MHISKLVKTLNCLTKGGNKRTFYGGGTASRRGVYKKLAALTERNQKPNQSLQAKLQEDPINRNGVPYDRRLTPIKYA